MTTWRTPLIVYWQCPVLRSSSSSVLRQEKDGLVHAQNHVDCFARGVVRHLVARTFRDRRQQIVLRSRDFPQPLAVLGADVARSVIGPARARAQGGR